MIEPIFLSVEEVHIIHEEQLDAFGGLNGIRDEGLLESAVMTPQASFGGEYLHADLFEMAAAYAFHIAENQPFLDGNKRTALGSAMVFLESNGYEFPLIDDLELYRAMIAIANDELDKQGLADIFRKMLDN
ncbi:MAG: type II toxin-antitoxin system death-on-curing family toxin [Pyrinomonadaceae bacterium]